MFIEVARVLSAWDETSRPHFPLSLAWNRSFRVTETHLRERSSHDQIARDGEKFIVAYDESNADHFILHTSHCTLHMADRSRETIYRLKNGVRKKNQV